MKMKKNDEENRRRERERERWMKEIDHPINETKEKSAY
jgi:hypothetical protein